uniref:Uncharacterized protein n=1 Tax=Pectobacterium carotovorum TaxID=554 RepID=A0A0K0MPN2_PECCA|nr:hypothetical protein [Pectobacterium carotovorum]AKG47553.1 hypothetical protein pA_00113 [Pectobacterium carotovorum]
MFGRKNVNTEKAEKIVVLVNGHLNYLIIHWISTIELAKKLNIEIHKAYRNPDMLIVSFLYAFCSNFVYFNTKNEMLISETNRLFEVSIRSFSDSKMLVALKGYLESNLTSVFFQNHNDFTKTYTKNELAIFTSKVFESPIPDSLLDDLYVKTSIEFDLVMHRLTH